MPVQKPSGQGRNVVSRSNSLIGTIKSILPSKLPWFGSSSNQVDTPSKRKQVREQPEAEEGGRGVKRQRMDEDRLSETRRASGGGQSHMPASQSAYLDPPKDAFGSTASVEVPRASPLQARASSAAAPSRHQRVRTRVTLSPALGARVGQTNRVVRTQSMDPPSRYRSPSYKPVLSPVPMTRDVSMEDVSFREAPSSPSRPFRMRTSLTPQLPEEAFGPIPARRERDSSEPPPLAALIEKPVFVRAPPPEATRQAIPPGCQGPLTLGAVADAQRTAKPLQRSHSSLKITSDSSMQDVQSMAVYAGTVAEKALQELEVYKTPLLPTRLRGLNTVPDMFKSKRFHAPVLMHDRDQKPRLGMADKAGGPGQAQDDSLGMKPYAGSGGMRKLLARRRKEQEEEKEQEKEKEKAEAIVTDEEPDMRQRAQELDAKLAAELQPPVPSQEPEILPPPVTSIGGREQPSLRVGRTRTSRNHILRPKLRSQAGRFSALYEDDEDDAMDDSGREREAKVLASPERASTSQPPAGFSFAKATPTVQFNSVNDKEPPISNLPFSLTKPTPRTAAGSSSLFGLTSQAENSPGALPLPNTFSQSTGAASPPVTVAASSLAVPAPAPSTPILAAVPQVALVPPSPAPTTALSTADQQADSTTTKTPSIPNFFANSALLSKSSAPATTPSFSLTPSASAENSSKQQASLFAPLPVQKDTPSENAPSSTTSKGTGDATVETDDKPSTLPFSFGKPPAAPIAAFSTIPVASVGPANPAKEKHTPAPSNACPASTPSLFSFGASSQPADQPASAPTLPFSFGTPTKQAEPTTAAPAASTAFPFGTPAKSVDPAASSTLFSFSTPVKAEPVKTDAESRPSTSDAARPGASLFGIVPVAPQPVAPFAGFGVPAAPATPEPPKTGFVFGQPTTPAPASTATTPAPQEAPKPLFGGVGPAFPFGQSAATSAPAPTKSSFQFGAAPATPTAESRPFTFGGSPATPSALFGNTVNGAGSSAAKSFAFGGAATPRELTPPKKEDSEVMMDESPARSTEMNARPELPKLNGAFSFNLPGASSPFGQNAQTSAPFGFGQSNTTPSALFGGKPEVKPAEKSSTPFSGFGQSAPSATTGFSFGQKPAETAPGPAATPFLFNSPATPSASTAPFGFGAPQISQSSSFGQPTSATTPVGSSPFGQAATSSGFTFGSTTPTTTTAPSNPFTFTGSQPASPAAASAGLPAQNGTGGFTFGGSGTAPAGSSSPFGASAALPSATGTLFTMGAAPPPPAGGRLVKKMPRRGGKR